MSWHNDVERFYNVNGLNRVKDFWRTRERRTDGGESRKR
jgi:hypothetical protein